ncbi:MAG TPA: hypothetical protein VH413_11130 [Verrucomicrobiae bacterium]|nr:hypothetical protein [Verrucomicrobiae bacterium]
MNAWKVILSTLVIFIAGVVTGGLLVTVAVRVTQTHSRPARDPNAPAASANPWLVKNRDLLRRMDRELELTPEQHGRIETIIAASQERTKLLWKPITPQMNKELQMVHAEIRDLLTPDQKKKFDDFPRVRPNPDKRRGTNYLSGNSLTNFSGTNFPATNAMPASQ